MYRFDIDTAIEHWHHWLRLNRSFNGEDLKELENHLRDHVEELIEGGATEEAAFRAATRQLGSTSDFEAEYDKVRFGRKKGRTSLA